jgi:hypothetical protein
VIGTSALSYGRILGANDRISLGIIGAGRRGHELASVVADVKGSHNAEMIAVCDLWKANRERAAKTATQDYGRAPRSFMQMEELLAQKDAFLCAARGVSLGIAFTKRFGAGLFGGEGFILERLQGDGLAFLHAGGTIYQRDLALGETLRVDTGCIVAFQPTVDYNIEYVGKIKSALFGGEGLFFATLRGPGRIWLQSLPFSRLAGRIYAAAPQTGRGGREEGSLLGGLGRLIDGDNS